MNTRHPSRLALAVFDCLVAGNEPLKGDLIEEFATRRSQWWLWRQVIGAAVCQRRLRMLPAHGSRHMLVLGAAVLILVSFEAVFVTNLLYYLVFGPPLPDVTAYFYLARMKGVDPSAGEVIRTAFASMYAPVVAIAASVPTAWLVSRFHQRHYGVSRGVFALSVMACTVVSLQLPFGVQFLTTLSFIVGLLMSGCVAASSGHVPARVA
jgi:hypothetical protein